MHENLLTPAAIAGQLNRGGPVRGPKDQPGNGPRPKPQLSLWECITAVQRQGAVNSFPALHLMLSLFPEHMNGTPFTGVLRSYKPRVSAFCRLATMRGEATAQEQRCHIVMKRS